MRTIVFTGGGTAGHVMPNLALIEKLKKQHWQISYIGSKTGIEKTLVEQEAIPYYAVETGKLRRYFSWKTFLAPFSIGAGMIQSYYLLRKIKPQVIFSKGGFVAFPVVIAGWLHKIPVIVHESDLSPGLANRLSFPFARQICLTFKTATAFFKPGQPTVITGTPIRDTLFQGIRELGLSQARFIDDKPCILFIGGSAGSAKLNSVIKQALGELIQSYNIIHLCGKGKEDSQTNNSSYYQIEFADKILPHLLAAADLVVSRAGANTLYELLALQKPHILIPLSKEASRGDQIENAEYFQQLGASVVIKDEVLDASILVQEIAAALSNKNQIINQIKALNIQSATDKIISLINKVAL